MSNPLISLGSLNRLVASITWATFPNLNVSASFLTPAGIDLALEGNATDMIPAMAGMVTSPAPYMPASITINLVKTLSIANLYKIQIETSTLLGTCTVRPDVTTGLQPFVFQNCAIESVSGLNFAGSSAAFTVICRGTYPTNSGLFT